MKFVPRQNAVMNYCVQLIAMNKKKSYMPKKKSIHLFALQLPRDRIEYNKAWLGCDYYRLFIYCFMLLDDKFIKIFIWSL